MKAIDNKRDLNDFYTRDSQGKLHLNAKSTLIGGYDPNEANQLVDEMTTYYQDIIVDLLEQLRQKDRKILELTAKGRNA